MATRHIFAVKRPDQLDGENLKEEIRQATGLRVADITNRPHAGMLEIALAGGYPAAELEAFEAQIRTIVSQHKGVTAAQVQHLTKREAGQKRRQALADKVVGGEDLTEAEVREAVKLWLLQEAEPVRRFDKRVKT